MHEYSEVLDIYSLIDKELSYLITLSNKTKFTIVNERRAFFDKVVEIEDLFLKANSILLDTSDLDIDKRVFKDNVIHPISSKQMSGWIKKIENNIASIYINLADNVSVDLKLVNKEQLKLIGTVIKVLRGDAYFVGCPRS